MGEILTHDTATALWHALVREGEQRAGRSLGEELESYLVFALMRHQGDAPLAHRIMAIELLEALQEDGRQREHELRDVGDRCLLIAGLYPELAVRRRVPLSYFIELGQGAYERLSVELRAAWARLYAELSQAFAQLVRVLVEVRRASRSLSLPSALDGHALALRAGSVLDPGLPGRVLVRGSDRPQ